MRRGAGRRYPTTWQLFALSFRTPYRREGPIIIRGVKFHLETDQQEGEEQ